MTDIRSYLTDYHEIPGTVTTSSTSLISLPPISRSLPTYQEAVGQSSAPILQQFTTAASETAATASSHPPLQDTDVEGFEHVTFEPTVIAPPPAPLQNGPRIPSQREMEGVPTMDESTVRDVLLSHVSQNLCWGLNAAKHMNILDIIPSSAFHYGLETRTEKRTAQWVHEPYTGQVLDTADNGLPPTPWEVNVIPPNPYRNKQETVEVPHTAKITNCHDCGTNGRRRCWSCFGNGETACHACGGTGIPPTPSETTSISSPGRVCVHCSGSGRLRCSVCLGPGQLPCRTCLARGRLKLSLRLTVEWKVYKSDRIVERTPVPDSLLHAVTGRTAFEEEKPVLWPINFFPEEAVNHASRELLDEHRCRFLTEKIMAQRQFVSLIPVYQINYQWQKYGGQFYIYGHDPRIYFPDYPQQECCGLADLCSCNVM